MTYRRLDPFEKNKFFAAALILCVPVYFFPLLGLYPHSTMANSFFVYFYLLKALVLQTRMPRIVLYLMRRPPGPSQTVCWSSPGPRNTTNGRIAAWFWVRNSANKAKPKTKMPSVPTANEILVNIFHLTLHFLFFIRFGIGQYFGMCQLSRDNFYVTGFPRSRRLYQEYVSGFLLF